MVKKAKGLSGIIVLAITVLLMNIAYAGPSPSCPSAPKWLAHVYYDSEAWDVFCCTVSNLEKKKVCLETNFNQLDLLNRFLMFRINPNLEETRTMVCGESTYPGTSSCSVELKEPAGETLIASIDRLTNNMRCAVGTTESLYEAGMLRLIKEIQLCVRGSCGGTPTDPGAPVTPSEPGDPALPAGEETPSAK